MSESVPRSVWVDGDGIRLHGLQWGPDEPAQQPLLMLHGVAGNAWIWEPVARRLRGALDDRWRIVALDGRDGGLTEHPPTGYEPQRFGNDLVAAHDAMGGRPMTLVGHSRGAWLAAWFAARHPERVKRLVLVDPARLAFASREDADRFYDWVRSGLGPFASRDAALAWARSRDPEADWNEARTRALFAGLVERPDGSLVGRLPIAAVEQLRAVREGEDAVGPRLAAVRCPVLLLVATRQSDPRRRDKLAYADALPDVIVEEVDGSHFLHTDAPDVVAGLIARFADPDQAAAAMPSSRRP